MTCIASTYGDQRLELDLDAVPGSIPAIRVGVTGFATGQGASPEVVADIALAVTEATTNSVLHAFVGREPGTVSVYAEPADGSLIVCVRDNGRGMTPRPDSPGLGLGLPTIGQLATSCDIRSGPDGAGTEVRMTFAAPGVRGPLPALEEDEERLRLLERVSHLVERGAWPGEGVDRLMDLLVPAVADAGAVDLLGVDGEIHRVVERHGDPAERDRMGITSWVDLPLRSGDQRVGVLGLGFRDERGAPAARMLFLEALTERVARGLATNRVVAELSRTRTRFARVLDALAEAVTVNDAEGRVVYANSAAVELLGAESVDEVLGAPPGELAARFIITREDGSLVELEDLPGYRVTAGLPSESLLTRSVERVTGRSRWLLTKATLLDDEGRLAVNIVEDVTEAKDGERRLRFIAEAADRLASTVDAEDTLQAIAGMAVPGLADWCAVDLVDDGGDVRRLALANPDSSRQAFGRDLRSRYPPLVDAPGGLDTVMRTGEAQLWAEVTDDMLIASARDDEHLRMVRELGIRSAIMAPMKTAGRTVGVLTFITAESRRRLNERDLELAEDLAQRAGAAIERARRRDDRGAT